MIRKKNKGNFSILRSTSESNLDEHHKNYLKFNKSDIFKPDTLNHKDETSVEKLRRDLKSCNLKDYMTKYQNSFPMKRKYKFGILKKHLFSEETKITSLTPKERKIKELYPKFKPKEIQQMLRSQNNSKNEESFNHLNKRYSENDIKRLKVDNIYRSSVFPNDNNTHFDISMNSNLDFKNKTSLIPASMDWKSANTELFFNGNKSESGNKRRIYNPAEMKQKELISHFNSKGNEKDIYELPKKNQDVMERQIAEISQSYSKQFSKFKENISSLHSKDFYRNAIKADSESIKIIPFEIENIKNITEFNIKDIKALISKNGLHAYDIQIESKLLKDEGNVKFKVRTGNESKLKTIQEKIKGLGLKCSNMESKNNNFTKNHRMKLQLIYDNNYKNDSTLSSFKNDIKFIEKLNK